MTDDLIENNPANAAIQYSLSQDCFGSERSFLLAWTHGDFDVIRSKWQNVPDAVFIGADPSLEMNAA